MSTTTRTTVRQALLASAALALLAPSAAHAGITGWWKLDGNGDDEIGTTTVTTFGSTSWVSGEDGQALRIDAQGGGAMMDSIVAGFGDSPFTVSLWIKYEGHFSGHARHEHAITSGWSGTNRALDLFAEKDGGRTYSWVEGPGSQVITEKTAPWISAKNVWHHVALGRDATTQYLCVDGEIFAKGPTGSLYDHTSGGPTYLGRNPVENGGRSWPGAIDEVQAYDEWIGADGCAALYAEPGSVYGSDVDIDGVLDIDDLCPTESALGWDLNGDGCLDDTDIDGVTDDLDTCPGGDDLQDDDGDEVPEFCDACPGDAFNDQDGDGLCTADDLCPTDYSDGDGDGSDDTDGDTICNTDDLCEDGDDLLDSDFDGMADDCDLCPLDSYNDADGDGVCGEADTCIGDDNIDQDDDGLPDDCDLLCPLDPTNDDDFDGVCGLNDVCPFDTDDDSDGDGSCDSDDICPNEDDFLDTDGDGAVDCQDACPEDIENDGDSDGLCESVDNCEGVANPDQADVDGDGIGNVCEPDSDADGLIDDEDNCAYVANASQIDADGDGQGDVCDLDDDGDTVADSQDICPATPATAPAVNSTGCSVDQTCSTTATWKNHGAYVSCVSNTASLLVAEGDLSSAQKDAIVSAAARSSVGSKK